MNNLHSSIKLCLCICAYDGLISDTELEVLFKCFEKTNSLNREQFEKIIDEFFEENSTLEDLYYEAEPLTDELKIAELAASADGLDLRENLALQKCYFLESSVGKSGDYND